MSLIRSSATIASFTMISRLLGFARDMFIANVLGASWLSDAFFVAFKLPNFFRRLFAEGAFNAAFIPQFSRLLASDDPQSARLFAGRIFTILCLALLVLCALFITFMPWLLQAFAPGFTGSPEQYALTVELARICFPYIFCISLVSLMAGILNAHKQFAAAAAAPILLNLSLMAALWFGESRAPTAAHALSYGVFAAGLLQLGWIGFFALRSGLMPPPRRPKISPNVRRFFKLLAPAALGAGVAQVNLFIDVVLASLFAQGVSYLYFADRLNQLPIGVIGVAVGTALLPMLSQYYKRNELEAAKHQMNRAIELVLLFALPAMAAFLVIAHPLISALYEHGAFDAADTQATYRALMAYAFGLPAFLLVKVLAAGFYGNEDTKTPFKIAIVCVIANVLLNLLLMQFMAHVGLALATALSGWLNATLMAIILMRRGLLAPDNTLKRRVPRFALSALLMAALLFLLQQHITFSAPLTLALLVIIGAASFFTCITLSGALRVRDLKGYLRRKQ